MSSIFSQREPDWTDMSDYIVHFTKFYDGVQDFGNLISILSDYKIEARSMFGMARDRAPDPNSQKTVCFTEVPLTHAQRITMRRSGFGLAFDKGSAIVRGANPILYAYKNQSLAHNLRALMEAAIVKGDPADPIFTVTPFVDLPGMYYNNSYFFEWEREWRKQGDYPFSAEEIRFLIVPEEHHAKVKKNFNDLKKSSRHGYLHQIPIIDIAWKRKRIRDILREEEGR